MTLPAALDPVVPLPAGAAVPGNGTDVAAGAREAGVTGSEVTVTGSAPGTPCGGKSKLAAGGFTTGRWGAAANQPPTPITTSTNTQMVVH